MFYSAQILSRKGPLGTCWLASWSQRGLKRSEVFNCSLPAAVDSIINPEAPLALRLSGQLLLGLVRLYLRRLQFLEEDAGLALRGLARNAAAAGQPQVDLPDGGVAPETAITLQDGGYDPMAQFVGNELFPSFESSLFGEGDLGGGYGAGGASLTVAQDISELFGSRWGGPEGEERFEVDGDATERRFSTELERLRSQGVEAPRDRADMFFGGGAEEAFSPAVAIEDEIMAVPPEDMFAGPGPTPGRTPRKTPLSAGAAPLPGLSDMRITPPSLPGGADLLPDIEAAGASAGTAGGDDGGFSAGAYEEEGGAPVLLSMALEQAAEEAAGAAAAEAGAAAAAAAQRQQAAPRRQAGPRRRRPTVDTGRNGHPATTLPSDEIRGLLADRKPLMTHRGLRSRRHSAAAPLGVFDVVAQSEAARESELFRPSSFSALCPELLELFGRALALPAGAAAAEGTPGAGRRRRSSRGTVAADEEAAAAAAAAAELAAVGDLPPLQEEEAPLSAGLTAGGPPSEFGGFSAGGFSAGGGRLELGPEDLIEPADTQQEQQAAGLFAAADEAEEEAEGARLAERRGRLPLQPAPYSGELPAELGSIGPDSTSGGAASGSSGAAAHHATAFTRNTALVLEHLRREFAPATGSKRRHPGSHGDLAAGMAALSLDSLLLGGAAPRGRLDAARWFYECLVLRNTGFVQLEQGKPYGDIAIAPTPLLTGGGGAGGGTPAGGGPPAP